MELCKFATTFLDSFDVAIVVVIVNLEKSFVTLSHTYPKMFFNTAKTGPTRAMHVTIKFPHL